MRDPSPVAPPAEPCRVITTGLGATGGRDSTRTARGVARRLVWRQASALCYTPRGPPADIASGLPGPRHDAVAPRHATGPQDRVEDPEP